MTADLQLTTPAQAVTVMIEAGAVFAVRHRTNSLGLSFTYRVGEGGDLERCRQILAAVKQRPAAFLAAFKVHVHDAVAAAERGAA